MITFADDSQLTFVQQFLVRDGTSLWGARIDRGARCVEVGHPVLAKLLQRVAAGKVPVLPFLGQGHHSWIIAGPDRRSLEHTLATASRFVVPTYAEFTGEGGAPLLHLFAPERGPLHSSGAQLYPAGYYAWRSPPEHLTIMLQRLDLWLGLEERRPLIASQRPRTYQELYTSFNTALAAGSWDAAERVLQELRQRHLTTADNLAFLQVQLLHQQTRWQEIWSRSDFPTLANLRMPRRVRAALLTGFHQAQLLPHEVNGDLDAALEALKLSRPRLGLLLTGRYELADPAVIRVFAYLAVLDQDRPALERLREAADDDASVELIEQLASRLAPAPALVPALDPKRRVRLAILDHDYDAALAVTNELSPIEQVLLLLDIAMSSMDVGYAQLARVAFQGLPEELQQTLPEHDPRIHRKLAVVEQLAEPQVSSTPSGISIADWSTWFARLVENPRDAELAPALERLVAADDEIEAHKAVQQLSTHLAPVVIDDALLGNVYTRRALAHLTNLFLKDTLFPRESDPYPELYEALYTGLLDRREVNQTNSLALIRLAEALLRRVPARGEEVSRYLQKWYSNPIPALEESLLESFELLAEYGVVGSTLGPWYREWATRMLSLPRKRERTILETWYAFGTWMQPGTDVLQQLQQALEDAKSTDEQSPIAALPAGYRIGIFTLRQSSGDRARDLLLSYNKNLDIRICTATDLNEQAKSIARNSDVSVIVTTCITHALTYGIRPYLAGEPIYPSSSGSSSIVNAIKAWAGQQRL